MARRRPVHRAARRRHGAAGPALRRQRPVRRAARRRRSARWPGSGSASSSCLGSTVVVLLRPQRLRVHRPRPRLADRPVRRAVAVAVPDGARDRCRRCAATASSDSCVLDLRAVGGGRSRCSTAPRSMYGRHTNLAMAEYWRWWVVHLWVEGFFEVFATAVIAFLFARLQLVEPASWPPRRRCSRRRSSSPAASSARCTTCTSRARRRWCWRSGAVFSALEVVPLLFVGYRGLAQPAAVAAGAVGREVPLADLLLRRRRVLEHGRRRAVRLHDQPADRALLHAGAEHDAGARPRRAVRRLRHARHRADAVLPARAASATGVEGRAARVRASGP